MNRWYYLERPFLRLSVQDVAGRSPASPTETSSRLDELLEPHEAFLMSDPQANYTQEEINEIIKRALSEQVQGERTLSTDELTGVQALERKHPGLPLAPGKVERREFEYIRHGTQSLIIQMYDGEGQIGELLFPIGKRLFPFVGPLPSALPGGIVGILNR